MKPKFAGGWCWSLIGRRIRFNCPYFESRLNGNVLPSRATISSPCSFMHPIPSDSSGLDIFYCGKAATSLLLRRKYLVLLGINHIRSTSGGALGRARLGRDAGLLVVCSTFRFAQWRPDHCTFGSPLLAAREKCRPVTSVHFSPRAHAPP